MHITLHCVKRRAEMRRGRLQPPTPVARAAAAHRLGDKKHCIFISLKKKQKKIVLSWF